MESELHRKMKESVRGALIQEGYKVYLEPQFDPSSFLTWEFYRPDMLGVRVADGKQKYAIVECETRPSGRRLATKNYRSLRAQTRLNSELQLRRILVIPRGTLARLDPSVRLSWETWIFAEGSFQLLPQVVPAPPGA